jgi:pimeloyl-ACP methyl ester carboxylesterase
MPIAKAGEIDIYYEIHGKGLPLIMILGLGQDLATWDFQVGEFSKHFRLIVFDNRDSGRSSQSLAPYTTEDMARDTLGLMDYLDIERAHVLGTSMGGMIAQQVAFLAPERVMRLVLASTTTTGKD